MSFLASLLGLILTYLGIGSLLVLLTAYLNAVTGSRPWFDPDRRTRWEEAAGLIFAPVTLIIAWPLFLIVMGAAGVGVAYVRMMERAGARVIRAGAAHRQRMKGSAP